MLSDKFGRNYSLIVQNQNNVEIGIEPPFTCEFDVERTSYGGANYANFKIYNLNEDTRSQIRRDITDVGNLKRLVFLGGYGNDLSVCFAGDIQKAWSFRQGTDFFTNILCGDGGFAILNASANKSYRKGATNQAIVNDIVDSLKAFGVSVGAIGSISGSPQRGNSYSGNTVDILRTLTSGGFFIDANKAYVLSDTEALEGEVINIDSNSGLLGTPLRENLLTTFDMLWDPRLFIGQVVNLDSKTFKDVNGEHKVISLKHRGIISESVAGNAITTVTCMPGRFTRIRRQG